MKDAFSALSASGIHGEKLPLYLHQGTSAPGKYPVSRMSASPLISDYLVILLLSSLKKMYIHSIFLVFCIV